MVTQPGDNLTVFRLGGDFDDCQSSVKAVFDDAGFAAELAERHRLSLSSANSINWGRLLPQIVYYVSAYADLAARGARRRRRPHRRLRPHRQLRQHPRRLVRQATWACRSAACSAPATATTCSPTSSRAASTTSPPARSSRRRRRPWTSSSRPTSSGCSTTSRGDPARIAGWMGDLKETGRFEVDDATPRQAARVVHRRLGRQRHLPRGHRPRAARAGLPARPAHGRRLGGRGAARRRRAGAHRQHRALEQVRRRRGARPHRRRPPARRCPAPPTTSSCSTGSSTSRPARRVPPQLRAVRDRPRRFDARVEAGREPVEASLREWLARGSDAATPPARAGAPHRSERAVEPGHRPSVVPTARSAPQERAREQADGDVEVRLPALDPGPGHPTRANCRRRSTASTRAPARRRRQARNSAT